MEIKAGLWQQQTLRPAMTQELSQAIALLQYSTQELIAFLENKALENPLLTIDDQIVKPVNPLRDRIRNKPLKNQKDWIEQAAVKSTTIEEQLLSQLNIRKLSPAQLKVIRHIIQHLDENGYFTGDLGKIVDVLKVPLEQVEDGLAIIQTLEPAGIGARNLQECLLIQLGHHELAEKIISEYFLLFADKKWKQIAKELDISLKEIQVVHDMVRTLNPKPGSMLAPSHTSYIIPDAVIKWTGNSLAIKMVDDMLPKVRFNEQYYQSMLPQKNEDWQVSRFLRERVQDYHWISKAIEQRRETLTQVITKIVEKQMPFFEKGPNYLLPMTMKEIGAELDIHESTVSRAVREKYVQTPSGTFTLKSFFTSTIQTALAEKASSAQVKNAISFLIQNENKGKPLSDQEIAAHLEMQEGIMVSRRTIAKYREQQGIPSSSKRKRFD